MTDQIPFRFIQLAGRGYCCSQIVMILALERRGETNADLVRSMAGLCHGVGMSGGICGFLTGAACILSLYGAKGTDEENADDRLPLMLSELMDWFGTEVGGAYGGVLCSEIMGDGDIRHPDPSRCGDIAIKTYAKITRILLENDFDLTTGRGKSR